ncbi:hypothetical protein HYU92_05420 [Candidatus Curtissbacteria bacterium]|nr:hypothetical protein [Candidatus Curtissbacteria bacterium]
MILIIRKKANQEETKQMAEDYEGYIKVVVDLEKKILAGGGEFHADAEKMLIADGSAQENLWGGGLDIESGQIDYNSMINLRPTQNNPSREILDAGIRKKFDEVVKRLLIND